MLFSTSADSHSAQALISLRCLRKPHRPHRRSPQFRTPHSGTDAVTQSSVLTHSAQTAQSAAAAPAIRRIADPFADRSPQFRTPHRRSPHSLRTDLLNIFAESSPQFQSIIILSLLLPTTC
nr:hypothetical protein Iba_chr09dCG7730 [Ipomoea batatas]